MTFKTALLLSIGILLGIPILTYFTIWWGVAAYHRARAYAKQYEDYEMEHDDNSNKDNQQFREKDGHEKQTG